MRASKDTGLDRITELAAQWYMRVREEELSQVDRAHFARWLRESPVHVREYLGIAQLWGMLHGARIWPAESSEELASLIHTASKVVSLPPDVVPSHSSIRWAGLFRSPRFVARTIAVAMLIALGATSVFYLSAHWGDSREFSTARGEQRSLVLSDGSVVQLNTLTRAKIRFDERARRVELSEGEAFFRVARDAKRPFEVVTPLAVVQAVGTEFNVYSRAHGTRVAVVEGKVRIALRGDSMPAQIASGANPAGATPDIALGARESVNVEASGAAIRALVPKPEATTAWIQRRLVFDNQRLDRAIEEFNLYNPAQMAVDDPELADLRISGVFDADDPGALVKYLERIKGVSISQSHGAVTIVRQVKGPPP